MFYGGLVELYNPKMKLFDVYVASILGELYLSFPEPTFMDSAATAAITPELIKRKLIDGKMKDEGCLETCTYTMNWLFQQGYFTGTYEEKPDWYDDAVLTEKGLNLLNKKLDNLGQSVGEHLSTFSTDVGKNITKDYMKEIIKWLINSIV